MNNKFIEGILWVIFFAVTIFTFLEANTTAFIGYFVFVVVYAVVFTLLHKMERSLKRLR